MKLSVVIPVLNEAEYIGPLLHYLLTCSDHRIAEIIVVDGGSSDATCGIVEDISRVTLLRYPEEKSDACRATQMNFAAKHARGDVLWFLHADCWPPKTFLNDIERSVERGKHLGGYAFDFDSKRFLLKVNSWFTRLNWSFTRGGDQSLFVTRQLWHRLSGYRPDFVIMEEYDLIDRAEALGMSYHRMKGAVKVSARKYEENTYMEVQKANVKAFSMYRRGYTPEEIKHAYFRMLKHPKRNNQ